MMSGDEADARSRARARHNQRRLIVVAVFVVAAFLALAGLLQRQQNELRRLVEQNAASTQQMCLQRQVNALRTNKTWDDLSEIERGNRFIDEDIRKARLQVYRDAHINVPVCAP